LVSHLPAVVGVPATLSSVDDDFPIIEVIYVATGKNN
jgi:hypothetical protein